MPALFLVCVHTQLEDWLLIAWMSAWMFGLFRSCFQNDLFLIGASRGILAQKEGRFPQHSFVKADVAMWGKTRRGLPHPFLCPMFVWTCQNVNLCSLPVRFIFHPYYKELYLVLQLSMKYQRPFFMLILTSAVFCSVILQRFLTCSGWLLQWSDWLLGSWTLPWKYSIHQISNWSYASVTVNWELFMFFCRQ